MNNIESACFLCVDGYNELYVSSNKGTQSDILIARYENYTHFYNKIFEKTNEINNSTNEFKKELFYLKNYIIEDENLSYIFEKDGSIRIRIKNEVINRTFINHRFRPITKSTEQNDNKNIVISFIDTEYLSGFSFFEKWKKMDDDSIKNNKNNYIGLYLNETDHAVYYGFGDVIPFTSAPIIVNDGENAYFHSDILTQLICSYLVNDGIIKPKYNHYYNNIIREQFGKEFDYYIDIIHDRHNPRYNDIIKVKNKDIINYFYFLSTSS